MARNRRSEKRSVRSVEFFEFVLTIWRTNSDMIADPAGRHIACSQFPVGRRGGHHKIDAFICQSRHSFDAIFAAKIELSH